MASAHPQIRMLADADEVPVIRVVRLRSDERAGPFWDDEPHVSHDFDELRQWLGISREMSDDVMAWNDTRASTDAAHREAGGALATRP